MDDKADIFDTLS